MPLFVPSGGGLARNQFLFEQKLFSDGADTSINFKSCGFDYNNNVFLVGGNTSFCGKFSGGENGKVEQFVALPSTVIAGGDVARIRPSDVDSGILVRIGNNMARSADGGATWVDITPAFAATYTDILSWQDDQLVACAGGGTEDLRISTDNGATYPVTKDIFSAAVSVAERTEDNGIIVFGCDNDRVFLTEDKNLATATYLSFDLSVLIGLIGNITTVGINPNGNEIILGTSQGDIAVSIDRGTSWSRFVRDENFFTNGAAAFDAIESCTYIDALDGFILQANLVCAFIPTGGALDTMQPVFNIANTSAGGEQSNATDGNDLIIVAGTNDTLRLPRLS
jgi:hypothetical protein